MKNLFLTLTIFATTNLFGQQTAESLMSDFMSGQLFIVNELAIADADSSFFQTLASLNIDSYERINGKDSKELYGTIGENGSIKIEVSEAESLNKEYAGLLDVSVLKHFNQEDSLFYHVDGLPNHDIYIALNILINKKIKTIEVLGPSQASAIWGKQEGGTGAIVINCNRDEKLNFK